MLHRPTTSYSDIVGANNNEETQHTRKRKRGRESDRRSHRSPPSQTTSSRPSKRFKKRRGSEGKRREYQRKKVARRNKKSHRSSSPSPSFSRTSPRDHEREEEIGYEDKVEQQLRIQSKHENEEDEVERKRRERKARLAAIKKKFDQKRNEPKEEGEIREDTVKTPSPPSKKPQESSSTDMFSSSPPKPSNAVKSSSDMFSSSPNNSQQQSNNKEKGGKEQGEQDEEEDDMFDMFSSTVPKAPPKPSSSSSNLLSASSQSKPILPVISATASDDTDGYYMYRIGEVLNGRYQVTASLGKGMFSNVIRAVDISPPDASDPVPCAIKVLRSEDHFKRTGAKEAKILKAIKEHDPDGKSNIVRLLDQFEDRGHLCLVFENMDLDLRAVLKKYGNKVGLSLQAVRVYAHKLFKALLCLKQLGLLHADLKPDNILVDGGRTVCKLADLGSALYTSEVEITPVLVSRYYRPPEIVMGCVYDTAIDVFSLGATLYELATGKYLFPSKNNNEHLKMVMQVTGMPPKKMLSKAQFRLEYFDDNERFLEEVLEPGTNKKLVKEFIVPTKPTRDIQTELLRSYSASKLSKEHKRWVLDLADLITKCLHIDPRKRIGPKEALQHSLFKTSRSKTKAAT